MLESTMTRNLSLVLYQFSTGLVRRTVPTPTARSRAMRRIPRPLARASDRLDLLRLRILKAPPAELRPLLASPGEPGKHALADHGSLEFGEYPHHLEHRLAGRRGRV